MSTPAIARKVAAWCARSADPEVRDFAEELACRDLAGEGPGVRGLEAAVEELEAALRRFRAMRGSGEAPIAEESAALPDAGPVAFRDDDLIELHVAAKRFDVEDGKIRRWCRTHNIGRKMGGRWMVSVSRIRKHMGR